MTRLSFRPRPLDVNKKLAIVRSLKELDGEDGLVNRSVHHGHIALDADNEPVLPCSKKGEPKEIPTPQCQIVPSYDVLYPATFQQPSSYIRRKPARAETEMFIEYDLDEEDEEWLKAFNGNKPLLSSEKFEAMLYSMELADAKLRMKAMSSALALSAEPGSAPPPAYVLGVKVPVLLQQSQAQELLTSHCNKQSVASSVYEYWKQKREKWSKPILRRLQPPPSVTDTNPFNVFRPREKAHRPNTRRMQRRENDLASLEKLRQVRRSLEEAQKLLSLLQKREETKKSLMDCEFELQRAALESPDVAKLYLEREAKRLKMQQQAAGDAHPGSSVAPSGLRLRISPLAGEEGQDLRGMPVKQEGEYRSLNGAHTPVVATKRRSASAASAAAAAAAAAGSGIPAGPQGIPVVRFRLASPDVGSHVEEEASRMRTVSLADGVEIHQLPLHRKKRRRNTVPLRGAAAASAAAAAAARLNARLQATGSVGSQMARSLLSRQPIKEPPRPLEPTMWFAVQPLSIDLLKKHLLLCGPEAQRALEEVKQNEAGLTPKTEAGSETLCSMESNALQHGESTTAAAAAISPVPAASAAVLHSTEIAPCQQKIGSSPFEGLPGAGFTLQTVRGRPRFGRGGRLALDRWDVLRGELLGGDALALTQTAGQEMKRLQAGEEAARAAEGGPTRAEGGLHPVTLRFAVHRHRSQPRWKHTAAKPPTPDKQSQGQLLDGGSDAKGEGQKDNDHDSVEASGIGGSQGDLKAELVGKPTAVEVSSRHSQDKSVFTVRQDLPMLLVQKPLHPHKTTAAGERKERGPDPPRNGLHSTINQQLVPA